MAAERAEHFLFREYSRFIKQWLIDTCYLSRYPKEENTLVVYATPARAFAKYIYPIFNGEQIRPTISFTLTQATYTEGENLLGFVEETFFHSDTRTTDMVKPPLIYSLTYSVTTRTVLMSDADILAYQLMVNASKNRKAAMTIDGQWAEFSIGSPREETNLEPGDAQDRIVRRGFDLTVPRAYLPQTYTESGVIETYDINYDTVEEII